MKAMHKRFIREKLIPFILRENGNGFSMDSWMYQWWDSKAHHIYFDGIEHTKPACDTVCCIGGSLEFLARIKYKKDPEKLRAALDNFGSVIGLPEHQAESLFHGWMHNPRRSSPYVWPKRYQEDFAKADTPLAKANVACNLLIEVAETNGAVLEENHWEEDGGDQ